MTDLKKPVSRRTVRALGYGTRRRIVATFEPGDILAVRLERTRTVYRAALSSVFTQLATWHANAELAARKAARKARKEAR